MILLLLLLLFIGIVIVILIVIYDFVSRRWICQAFHSLSILLLVCIHQLWTEIRGKRIKWEIIDKYSISGCDGCKSPYIGPHHPIYITILCSK